MPSPKLGMAEWSVTRCAQEKSADAFACAGRQGAQGGLLSNARPGSWGMDAPGLRRLAPAGDQVVDDVLQFAGLDASVAQQAVVDLAQGVENLAPAPIGPRPGQRLGKIVGDIVAFVVSRRLAKGLWQRQSGRPWAGAGQVGHDRGFLQILLSRVAL